MPVDRVLLAAPRGFCAGVEMAIKALAWMVRAFEPPVYCYHEIVHNQVVVDRFERLGVVFVDDVTEVPEGAPLMLSAHGSAPEVVAAARARGGAVVNAVCPLVTKVHHEVKVRAGKGYSVVYVGHEGHDEAVGTMAVAPESIHLVEHEEDVAAMPDPGGPVALLAQTTLSHHDWAGVLDAARERWPQLWMPGRSDLCCATSSVPRPWPTTATSPHPTCWPSSAGKGENGPMAATFTRMDESTAEQWAVIGAETAEDQPRCADVVLDLLRSLKGVTIGFAVDQLTHCLQTATLAERAGADEEV